MSDYWVNEITPLMNYQSIKTFGFCAAIRGDANNLIAAYRGGVVLISQDSGVIVLKISKRFKEVSLSFQANDIIFGFKNAMTFFDKFIDEVESFDLDDAIRKSFKHSMLLDNVLLLSGLFYLLENDLEISNEVSLFYDRCVELRYIKE